MAVALNAVDNAILKNVTNSKKKITVTNHPLPRTLKQKSDDLNEYVNKFLRVDILIQFVVPAYVNVFDTLTCNRTGLLDQYFLPEVVRGQLNVTNTDEF